ncbi:MAG: lolD [Parachlamydiales bacterium]|nr:lolD [Parachlamydiales bacterium]
MTILHAENLRKSFFDPKRIDVIANISLQVRAGESIAICGRSGEGKTTLLHILGLLEEPDAGSIVIAGQIANRGNAYLLRQQHIGFIFQSFNLLEDFSVIDNILMPAHINRQRVDSKSPAYHMALEHLQSVDLLDRLEQKAKLLSGGERQRVAIARALCNNPSLIFADEPSGNLDRANAVRIGELLMQCVQKKKKSLILATHDPALAALCDRRFMLQDGALLCYTTHGKVF